MSPEDYLELISVSKALIEGETILSEIANTEPDFAFIEKHRRRIADLEQKIIEMTKG
ncbi:hypothetical protein P4597_18950 [Peribacillus simplex]|uniref:hypothetical protein n=1 Tax=Peribacillus simplex TaxID=1478 RepID=UPI002E1B5947|nr:hypothetical protein [Peribacillus simplex]